MRITSVFDVAVVLLIGVIFAVARPYGEMLLKWRSLSCQCCRGRCLLLPGPTPMLLADQMNADFGWMILIGLCAAIPGMLLAGPILYFIITGIILNYQRF